MRRDLLERPWGPINPILEAETRRQRFAGVTYSLARQLLKLWDEGALAEEPRSIINATPVLLSPIPATMPISDALSTWPKIFAAKRRIGPSQSGAVSLDTNGTRNEGLRLVKVGQPTNVLPLTDLELGEGRTPGITHSGLVVTGHLQQLTEGFECVASAADPDLLRQEGQRIVVVAGTIRSVLRALPMGSVPGASGLSDWHQALQGQPRLAA